MLSKQEKNRLVQIARQSMENYLQKAKAPSFDISSNNLKKQKGAFVTVKVNGQLAGCIGRIEADIPLYETISKMAIEAAFRDPRFPGLKQEDLKIMDIEISVLSELKPVKDINNIKVSRHGLLIKKGFNQGLLLPQVATEYNWNRKTFLQHTCLKAGLNKDCWKQQDTQIFLFEAEVFSEKELSK
jgi:AmmeMemoRadiSam system protein A